MKRALLPLGIALLTLTLGCGGGGGGEEPPPFRITSSDPQNGDFSVGLNKVIRVTFNKQIDPASVTATTLTLTAQGAATQPTGTTTVDPTPAIAGRRLLWTPAGGLPGGLLCTCHLDTSVRSVAGEGPGGALSFRFTTEAAPPPPAGTLARTSGDLNAGRRFHTATLLDDGRVLVVGGFHTGDALTNRVELFSTLTERFVEISPSFIERSNHTATKLLDGRVLVCGGYVEAFSTFAKRDETSHAEIFDPTTNQWHEVGPLMTGRVDAAAFPLPDGRVMVTGGSQIDTDTGGFFDLDDAEVFDPITETFAAWPSLMTTYRSTHVVAALPNGKFALGGGSLFDNRFDIFDPGSGLFMPSTPIIGDRIRFGAAMDTFESGAAEMCGGDNAGTCIYLRSDGSGGQIATGAMFRARGYATATRITPTKILVVGGVDFAAPPTLVLQSSDVIEETGGVTPSRILLNRLNLPEPLAMHTATKLPDGRVLLCGGLNVNGGQEEIRRAYLFTPAP